MRFEDIYTLLVNLHNAYLSINVKTFDVSYNSGQFELSN